MEKHRARKRFGQHFLVDRDIIERIVDAIHPKPQDRVLEIGPGLGALTRPMLDRIPQMMAIELDRDVVKRLRAEFPPERLAIYEGDVLDFDLTALGDQIRVIGNLPYNISTPILFKIAECAPHIRDAHFMLQKEVVERMVALPGTPDYGRLSVMLQWAFELEWVLDVPPEAFDPPPRVDSAVVRMIPKRERLSVNERQLQVLVAQAFSQRRKMLRANLKLWFTPQDLEALGVAPTARAEELSLEDFVRLARSLSDDQI